MRPHSKNLAVRDSAAAILLGALAKPGADFGHDYSGFHGDYQFGEESPSPQEMQRVWQDAQATKRRTALLNPNAGSSVSVQRYAFGVTASLVLGTASSISASGSPETNFRPQRITCNAPSVGFARISSIKVANVGIIVGGQVDAYDFDARGADQQLDVPTLSPANSINVTGLYSGLLPSGGFVTSTAYEFITSFKGPANMAGGS